MKTTSKLTPLTTLMLLMALLAWLALALGASAQTTYVNNAFGYWNNSAIWVASPGVAPR